MTETPAPQTPIPPPPLPPEPARRRRHSPGAALVLSFLPGLGHVYLGLYGRGAAIFLAFLAAQALAGHTEGLELGVIFLWFFGVIDAYRMAQLSQDGPAEPAPPRRTSGDGRLGFGVFLTVVGAVLLVNNFHPLDLSWLADWWPALLVGWGLYLLAGVLRERRDAAPAAPGEVPGAAAPEPDGREE